MPDLKWKYVSPLKEGTEVDVLELKYCYKLPDDLKKCIVENNAGVPSLSTFNLGENRKVVFGGLLSFNNGELDNIYDYIGLFEAEDGKKLKMFPFALDPAGNFFCIENGKMVFYSHEADKTIVICDSFTEFLSRLYA